MPISISSRDLIHHADALSILLLELPKKVNVDANFEKLKSHEIIKPQYGNLVGWGAEYI
jgi:hypothetical protein